MANPRGYPYPTLDSAANAPLAFQSLAEAVSEDVQQVDTANAPAREGVAGASPTVIANALVKRDGNGRIAVPEPAAGGNAVNRDYVDGLVAPIGAATPGIVPDTLVKRDSNGRIGVPAPAAGTNAVNRDYVDGRTFGTRVSVALAANDATPVTVTFPAGRFTGVPVASAIAVTGANPGRRAYAYVSGVGTTSATFYIRNDGTAFTADIDVLAITRG